jgi:alanine dehydrogenase
MKVGVVKEIKNHEYRVGMTPSCAKSYVGEGHQVFVEKDAGLQAGFDNEDYRSAGAHILEFGAQVYEKCDMIVKVKEPQASEVQYLREGQILFTYLHLAAVPELAQALLDKKVDAVAYETIEDASGQLCCLRPMSEIAGRLATQEGAKYLERPMGGKGVLLGGVPGVRRGRVVILGGGVVGTNAAKIAVGMGAEVSILDVNGSRLSQLDDLFGSRCSTLYCNESHLEQCLRKADLVIGAVLIPGARAPQLVRREHLDMMEAGTVMVDVAVDQGGCIESIHPTTHDDPTYVEKGIVHYGVANMPGAVALTSTLALTSTTLPFGLQLARHGVRKACSQNDGLAKGINLLGGACVYGPLAESLNLPRGNWKSDM